ncbi:uncharacterized protein YbjT (DUF2867 family) [Thermocatellispora tengchongensis]|uniref:Uncharacterized protein YbjT (DUF2867 family) n=1 Tax=Thermocatellispora tengchongensis TaxID=1073253 RepID=A0A840PGN6_9ACTN|nr:NmrA/HSCARG family protein [Thermocatellispora tengchongensis]MBB5138728.1 uncharacterized protein YbjT (DUF2867 family) [Thermocatellispora tengchongensis]
MEQVILVTGATGQQGGATARWLLEDGWRVRVLARDPGRAAVEELAEAGAEVVAGDMADRASLDAAVAGAYGVFSVQPAAGRPERGEDEVRMGVNVAEAAHAAGVRHLVYASVGGAERGTGIPHWETKWRIEQRIRELGLTATILRPVMFMENHAHPTYGALGAAPLVRTIPPHATVQLIAVRDIGVFAALAFADPERFAGQALEIAGDELPRDELVAAMAEALGREVPVEPLGDEALRDAGVDETAVRRSRSFGGWQADIPALRALHPGLLDFRGWLAAEGRELLRRAFG